MGKKREAREAAERAAEAARAAAAEAERLAEEARAAAEVEPVGETMTKAERKAAKRAKREAFRDLTAEQAAAGVFGPTATGNTVTAATIPDVEDVAAALRTPTAADLQTLAASMDPTLQRGDTITFGDPQPTTPPPTPEPTDPDVVVVSAPVVVEPEGVEPVERDQWGRPKVLMPDGSMRGYRRVTTFIDVLEDKSSLEAWGKRMVLEGALLDYRTPSSDAQPSLINRVGKAIDARDADRAAAELNLLSPAKALDAADKRWKDAMKALTAEASDRAGAHDKATKGTDLHALTELVDQGLPLPAGITDADLRDLAAYEQAVKAAGIVFTERERFVVLDDLGVGGTLDRAGLYRFPGTARATRCVMDIKTGSVKWAPGKIAMQLAAYAHGLAYDRDTRERTDLKLSKAKALLIHLPAGEGRCLIYQVDIAAAWSKAVRLAEEVYQWRTEGKSVFDVSNPLVSIDLAATAA